MKKKLAGLSILLVITFGMVNIIKKLNGKIEKIKNMSDKHLKLFLLMNQWVKVKQEGKNLARYFEKNDYIKLAIYGMSYVGETLLEELEKTNIQVAYAIDRNLDGVYANISIVSPEGILEEVDAIVVTAIASFDEIAEELYKKIKYPVISLEDILYEI